MGLLGGLAVAATGVLSLHYGLMRTNLAAIFFITAAAFLGSYIESIAGSWNRRQEEPVPNGVLNFFNTAVGAVLFYAFSRLLG